MMPGKCRRNLEHDFDPISGWCLGGCGWRDDGKSQYRPRNAWDRCAGIDVTEPRHPKEDS